MAKNRVITVQGIPVTVSYEDIDDYICITDIAAAKSDNSRAADVIRNWLRNRSTLEFLSTWEEIYNPNFKVFESEHFKKEAGLVTFTPSVSEWVEKLMQLDCMLNVENTAEHLRIRILHLNLLLLSVRCSNCT